MRIPINFQQGIISIPAGFFNEKRGSKGNHSLAAIMVCSTESRFVCSFYWPVIAFDWQNTHRVSVQKIFD